MKSLGFQTFSSFFYPELDKHRCRAHYLPTMFENQTDALRVPTLQLAEKPSSERGITSFGKDLASYAHWTNTARPIDP